MDQLAQCADRHAFSGFEVLIIAARSHCLLGRIAASEISVIFAVLIFRIKILQGIFSWHCFLSL